MLDREQSTPHTDFQRKIPCFNNSETVTLPAFGSCSAIDMDVDDTSGEGSLTVDVPANDNDKLAYFVTEAAIPPQSSGFVQVDFPALALYDDADGTPGLDEQWGTKAGEVKLRKGKTGFLTRPWAAGVTPRISNSVVVEREVCRF